MHAQTVLHEAVDDLGADETLDCLVAVEDGSIIGVVVYTYRDDQGFGVIYSIGVAVPKQNNGIATDLKRQVLDNCSAAGATRVRSSVHRKNGKMQSVNKTLGIPATTDPEDGKYLLYSAELLAESDEDAPG